MSLFAWRAVAAVAITSVLSACVVGPDYGGPPEVQTPTRWNGALEGGLTAGDLDPRTLATWWAELNDPVLTQLVEAAIDANLDLRTAASQLRQARAERALTGASRFPTLDGRGSATQRGSVSKSNESSSQLYSGGFDAAWELDVFGGLERGVEASEADYLAAQEARRDVLVSVIAEVALNYLELRTFQLRYGVAERSLALQDDSLGIVKSQYDNGAATGLDYEQAMANRATTRASLLALSQQIEQSKNRLTTLLGEVPGVRNEQLDSPSGIPVPPVEVVIGVPADVLRRRPDVRAAERRFAAETARVGVATAELYPKFFLNGSVGIESLSAAGATGLYNVGPEVRLPVFDAGRRRRKIEIQDEAQEQAMIAYESAVLTALEETENAMTSFVLERERLSLLHESTAAAERAAAIASRRYEAGYSPFLEVLDSQRTMLSAEDERASSEGAVASNLVRLYKALGGGWSTNQGHADER